MVHSMNPAPEPSVLTPDMREFLEWSWDYDIAETLGPMSTKERARWVSSGILNGHHTDDADLIRDFLQLRITDLETSPVMPDLEWNPEPPDYPFTWDDLRVAMSFHPDFGTILAEVQAKLADIFDIGEV